MFYNLALFIATTLIWGSTWLAIHWQIGDVSPFWSVTYRFFIAAIILLIFCVLARKRLRYSVKEHFGMFCQGVFLFSVNYLFYYFASKYLISGLVAIIYATIMIMNIINSRIFFKSRLQAPVIYGALFGLAGLIFIFSGQFADVLHSHVSTNELIVGLVYSLIGTLLASFGNMLSAYNQKNGLPILQTNTFGMLYGAIVLLIIALCSGQPATFNMSSLYIGSLFYLAIVGSVVAFGTYLALLGRTGPERAAYVFVVLPIIALLLSTIYESFSWTLPTLIGLILVMLGNVLIILPSKQKKIPLVTTE